MGSRCWLFLAFKALEYFKGNPRFMSVSWFPHCYLSPSLLLLWPCIRNCKTVPQNPSAGWSARLIHTWFNHIWRKIAMHFFGLSNCRPPWAKGENRTPSSTSNPPLPCALFYLEQAWACHATSPGLAKIHEWHRAHIKQMECNIHVKK